MWRDWGYRTTDAGRIRASRVRSRIYRHGWRARPRPLQLRGLPALARVDLPEAPVRRQAGSARDRAGLSPVSPAEHLKKMLEPLYRGAIAKCPGLVCPGFAQAARPVRPGRFKTEDFDGVALKAWAGTQMAGSGQGSSGAPTSPQYRRQNGVDASKPGLPWCGRTPARPGGRRQSFADRRRDRATPPRPRALRPDAALAQSRSEDRVVHWTGEFILSVVLARDRGTFRSDRSGYSKLVDPPSGPRRRSASLFYLDSGGHRR